MSKSNKHYFASCVFGWSKAATREEAIHKLAQRFRRDLQRVIADCRKRGEIGAYVWTCEVLAPLEEAYAISFYQPKGVDIDAGREHSLTRITAKTVQYVNVVADTTTVEA